MHGAGSYLRKSEMTDPDLLAKYPFLPVIATSFEHGDGDFRPRIPAISGIAGPDRQGGQRGAGRPGRSQGRDGRHPGQGGDSCSESARACAIRRA